MGKGKFPEELTPAMICLRTGWTLDELDAQPDWFVQDIVICMNAETIAAQSQSKGK